MKNGVENSTKNHTRNRIESNTKSHTRNSLKNSAKNGMPEKMNRNVLVTYIVLTFAITWISWWMLALLISQGILSYSDPVATGIRMLGGFGPTISAILVLPQKNVKNIVHFIFSHNKNTVRFLLLFCFLEAVVIGISSRKINSEIAWFVVPVIFLMATFVGGGNEELGWRGVMQPKLEAYLSYPVASLVTGFVWALWHLPLWFVEGATQQDIPFALFTIFALFLSFWLATIYKKTNCVFYCCIFHGLSNLLISFFIINVNWILGVGLMLMLCISIWLYYSEDKSFQTIE